ncbi:MAG: B12-binding domain-containing radical SAM protein [Deltaproteobacteria bacterium]|nr:B12-binding domain-containing radical SAM protein [Deltaproteobacteria bacterium]
MLRIALVNLIPKTDTANYLGFNHALAYVSSVLKNGGHQTRLFTISSGLERDFDRLSGYRPNALFVYLTTNQYALFESELRARWVRLNVPVFVGGPHATSCPDELVALEGVTGVCIGEGENSALIVAQRIERGEAFEGIANIWFKRGGRVIRNDTGYCEADLDALPFPDRDCFPYKEMLGNRAIRLMGFEFLTSRGCVYACRYCINPLLRRINNSKARIRRRSIENVIREIQSVTKRYDYSGIVGFHDDIFTLDEPWLEQFAREFRRSIGLPFWCNAHINNLDEAIISSLRRGGCFRVHVGIECGNEEVRSRLLNKRISNREILEKVAMLKKHRMKIVTTFMIGLPDESEAELRQSIDLCRAIAPDWVLLSVFCPYPGTSLYETLVAEGKLDAGFYRSISTESFYSDKAAYSHNQLSPEKLSYYFNNFTKLASITGKS